MPEDISAAVPPAAFSPSGPTPRHRAWRSSLGAPGGAPSWPPNSEREAPTSTSTQRTQALAGMRVLVVEDDDDARELLCTILAGEGAVVESAASAAAGFAALRAFAPALLISDIAMPFEDGYSLMRRIRALGAEAGGHLPAIALTAFTRNEDRREALRAGFTLHISKPIVPRALVTVIAALMSSIQS